MNVLKNKRSENEQIWRPIREEEGSGVQIWMTIQIVYGWGRQQADSAMSEKKNGGGEDLE